MSAGKHNISLGVACQCVLTASKNTRLPTLVTSWSSRASRHVATPKDKLRFLHHLRIARIAKTQQTSNRHVFLSARCKDPQQTYAFPRVSPADASRRPSRRTFGLRESPADVISLFKIKEGIFLNQRITSAGNSLGQTHVCWDVC